MELFLPLTVALAIIFIASEIYGQNKATCKLFNNAKQISDDILNRPVCIKETKIERNLCTKTIF